MIFQRSFAQALSATPNGTHVRYKLRGQPVNFFADGNVSSEIEWLAKRLTLEYTNEGLNVTSIAYRDASSGKFYCKLLSPYRALEFIYLDSMRGWIK